MLALVESFCLFLHSYYSMPRLGSGGGSTTITITEPERVNAANTINRILTLHLRERKKVKWAEDVVDNENMGKKSSKSKLMY